MKNLSSAARFLALSLILSIIGIISAGHSSNFKIKAEESDPNSNKKIKYKKVPIYDEKSLVDSDKPHTLVGAYYNVRNSGSKSKLMLNNKGLYPIEVQPTLYGVGGAILQVPPVTIDALSNQFIDIADWANLGGSGFEQGNIKLFHRGKDLVIGAQIHLIDESKSLGFEYKIKELGTFNSRRLEAVWWSPSNKTEMDVVLTNTSEEFLTITANLTKKPAVSNAPQTITLLPHETKVLNVRDDFNQGKAFANKKILGLSLSHNGAADALLAWTMIKDESIGYSNTALFNNPDSARSKQYHGAGLQLGKIGGDKLEPVVIVRNTSDSRINVNVSVPYTKDNEDKRVVELDTIRLAPGELQEVDMTKVKQLQNVKVAGVAIEHTGKLGSVIADVQSVSQNKTQVFKTLLWNVNALKNSAGKYPFFIEDTTRTNVYIKNVSNRAESYISFITWDEGDERGMYMIGIKEIAPQETVELDFKKLRDEQTPDEEGRVLPENLTKGKISWMLRQKVAPSEDDEVIVPLVGQMQQIDTDKGINLTYFCSMCCDNDAGAIGAIDPNDKTLESGSTQDFDAYEVGQDCYGDPYVCAATNVTWSSSNTSVATVNSSGNVTTVGTGEADITATFYVPEYREQIPDPSCTPGGFGRFCQTCTQHIKQVTPTVDVTSVSIQINSPASEVDGNTATFSTTVTGGTPTSYQWSHTSPTGAGNNPQVNFLSPTASSTTAKAHWFALPNNDCSASNTSTYTIKVALGFSDGTTINKEAAFNVTLPNEGGRVDATVNPPAGSLTIQQSGGTWTITGHSLTYPITYTKTINLPATSQFYQKVDTHEEEHYQDWDQPTGLFRQYFNINTLYTNHLQGLTSTVSQQDLLNQALAQINTFHTNAVASAQGQCNQSELDAYAVSDLINPLFFYQRCGRTTFPNC